MAAVEVVVAEAVVMVVVLVVVVLSLSWQVLLNSRSCAEVSHAGPRV